jgi:hypothetical protein
VVAADNRKPFTLRLDDDTMDVLRTVARLEERTLNGLIEELVEQGLPNRLDQIEGDLAAKLAHVRSLRSANERLHP